MDALTKERTVRSHRAAEFAGNLLVSCAALLVSLSSPAPSRAADDHPRLGLYGHINGRGAPIVSGTGSLDAALLDRIARRHMVIIDASPLTEYRPDVLDALRARRPGIKLIGYVQAHYIYRSNEADSSVNIPTQINHLVRDLDGYLYNLQGVEYNSANINLAKRDAQGRFVMAEGLADFFVDEILATGRWDGMFFDRFCTSISFMQSPAWTVDHVRAGYPSFAAFDVAWRAATDTLANRIRRRAGNAPILIGNCGQGNKFEAFNGWMRENFPYQNGETWQTNMFWDPGGYLGGDLRFRTPHQSWIVAWPTSSTTPYSAENMRRARMALGSAALEEGYGTINPPDIDPTTGYMNWWYDEYAVNRITGASSPLMADTGYLGRATGPYRQMIWIQPGAPDAASLNPGFENSVSTGWVFATTVGSTVTRDVSTAADGMASAKVHLTSAAGNVYSTMFTTTGSIPYVEDTHSATFWAKASQPRTIYIVPVNLEDGPMGMREIPITTTWQRYQVTVAGQVGIAKLQFRLGNYTGDVWLDDVHFQRGAPNVYRRDFDYGTVLVNPSLLTYDVAIESKMRRITGLLDPAINNGTSSSIITVRPNDAAFLLKPVEELVGVGDPVRTPGSSRLAWSAVSPSPARAGAETIRLQLAVGEPLDADVVLFDARGRRVRTVFSGALAAGTHVLAWDGRDEGGRTVAPGLYFARARAGTSEVVRKLVCR